MIELSELYLYLPIMCLWMALVCTVMLINQRDINQRLEQCNEALQKRDQAYLETAATSKALARISAIVKKKSKKVRK